MQIRPTNRVVRFYLAFAGLLLNLVGALLIFFAFSFSSSAIDVYKTSSGTIFLSVNGQNSQVGLGGGSGLTVNIGAPPEQPISGRIALVNSSHPRFAWTGLVLIVISFIPSVLLLEYPENIYVESKTSVAPPTDFP
jgi:hypothetical protein